jgi:hypothetical protein
MLSDGNTLREVAQKISIRQEGNEVIDDLLKEISKVDKRKEAVLKLIDF